MIFQMIGKVIFPDDFLITVVALIGPLSNVSSEMPVHDCV